MDFNESLAQFIKRVESLKDSIQTEEATKTAIIMPFFSLLGYDVFNPNEFAPEYTADVGIKKGEKVDYAILQEGVPVVIIEAKVISRSLEKQDSQLFRYFSTTPAKIAILTNGLRYRFFTDLENQNKLDVVPFLDFNLLNMRRDRIEELKNFRKENFNVARISDSASTLKYQSTFTQMLTEQFENPSDEFVRFFLQGVYSGVRTQTVVDRFRPILKNSMQEFISDTVNAKIKSAFSSQPTPAPAPAIQPQPPGEPSEPSDVELNAFYYLRDQIKDYVNPKDITYKKTESYTAILYQGNTRKWICRLIITNSQISIILPSQDKREMRFYVANFYELDNYTRYMLSVLARYTELLQPLTAQNPPVYQVVFKRRYPKYTAPGQTDWLCKTDIAAP